MTLSLSTHEERGRALPAILIALALGAIAFLFFGDLLGLSGDGPNDGIDEAATDGDMDGSSGDGTDADAAGEGITLAGLYGEGDRGALRIRLLWVAGSKPVIGQPIVLVNRRGMDVAEVPTDQQGVAVFGQLVPGRGYSFTIAGEGFRPVQIRGVTVPTGTTKNLDDIYLGENVVLRGRVLDIDGKALPASSVSVFDGRGALQTDGIMFRMVSMAMNLPSPLEQAQTGTDGYFTLTTLNDGVYRLVARHAGYASEHEKDVVVQTDRSSGTLTLVLGEGARLFGKVEDSQGNPVVGARVIAVEDAGRFMSMQTPQREYTTTDETGAYVLDTLRAKARYRFGVIAKGFMPLFDTGGIEVEGKRERDFILPIGGTLTGQVFDKDSQKPIADASVAVYVGEFNFRGNNEGKQAGSTILRTDKEGRFRVTGVNPGPIASAQVKAVGYVTASFSQWSQNQWEAVAEDATTEVRVELERGGIVKGVVLNSEDKSPVMGATVILDGGGWGGMMQGLPSTVTDDNGQYLLQGVRAGEYTVVASADGFAPARAEDAKVTMTAAGGEHAVDLALSQAGVVRGIIKDANGEPVVGVRVRVTEKPEEDPAAGNNQRGRGRGRGRGGSMTMRMLQSTRAVIDMTGTDGKFTLRGVGTGRWVVVAESEEYVRSYSQPFRLAAGETEEADVTMVEGAILVGRVIDDRGGPVKGAVVRVGHLDDADARRVNLSSWRVDRQLDNERHMTDSSGRFRIEGLEAGITVVKVEAADYMTWYRRDIRVRAGEVHDGYTVSLSSGATIEGVVRGADGQPLVGVYVAVTKRDDPTQGRDEMAPEGEEPTTIEANMSAQTDAQGRFKIEKVPAEGQHSVVIWFAAGHQSYRQGQDESAIRRNVRAPARGVDFKLKKSEPAAAGGRGRGGR